MGYANEGSDDMEKLRQAFAEVTAKFGSIDDILEAFGLATMPKAQRYGILFGFLVFFLTVSTVITLLILGGSFKRIVQQSQTGESTIQTSHDARAQRALLLEQLLEGRQRMLKNYPKEPTKEGLTNLTKMLLNVAPDSNLDSVADFVVESGKETKKAEDSKRYIPPQYQENYVLAYRKCQDKPGGGTLSGRPEARFEAYARGYAGCGPYTSLAYRRSYGRMYEAICCASHASDDKYLELFKTRPHDIVGRAVRLEALESDRHLKELFRITSGQPAFDKHAYDPQEVWSFLEDGPFANEQEMRKSFVFQRKTNEAAFALVDSITDKLIGVAMLTHDDPSNLAIQMEAPIVHPKMDGSQQQLEACFLLMDRLFAYGYRRIQISVDSQDSKSTKLATRLGFTFEGVLLKHLIIKEASRDSNVYSMLNSDWKKGARNALFRTLYGANAQRADAMNEKKEEEHDEQQRVLAEKKQLEADAVDKKKN